MVEVKRGIIVFAMEIEAQKVADFFRQAGLPVRTTFQQSGEFEISGRDFQWRSMICGPGSFFSKGLKTGLTKLGYCPSLALLAGFAGGLAPNATRGTVWVGSRIQTENGIWKPELGPIMERVSGANPGKICFSKTPICRPGEKSVVYETGKPDIVDMESGYFAETFTKSGIPFGVIRAVSDGPGDTIPPEVCGWAGPNGKIRIDRMAWDLVCKPRLLGALPKLAEGAKVAGMRLGMVLSKMIQSDEIWRTTTPSRP